MDEGKIERELSALLAAPRTPENVALFHALGTLLSACRLKEVASHLQDLADAASGLVDSDGRLHAVLHEARKPGPRQVRLEADAEEPPPAEEQAAAA